MLAVYGWVKFKIYCSFNLSRKSNKIAKNSNYCTMNYTENYNGIKIDVQAPQVDLPEGLQAQIRKSIDKISRFTDNIIAVDLYFNISGTGKTAERILGMRIGIPGPDVFSEEKGKDRWNTMLRSVTDKNIRQLQKDK
jgi:ribosomal subunit interface protein